MSIALRKATPAPSLRGAVFEARPTESRALLPDTSIHPIAVAIPVATSGWFVTVSWCAFGGGETSLILAVIGFFCVIFFGLLLGCAAIGRDMTPDRAHGRRFGEFLRGDLDIETGRIKGLDALWQIAAMPIGLAVGFTLIAIIAVAV